MSDFYDMLADLHDSGWLGFRKRGRGIEESSNRVMAGWWLWFSGSEFREKYEAVYFCGVLSRNRYHRLDRVTAYGGRIWLMTIGDFEVECAITNHNTLKAVGRANKNPDYFGEVTAHSARALIEMIDENGMRTHREYLCGVIPVGGVEL